MENNNKPISPKVFISYSWKPESHKSFVIELAERLQSDGVLVIIDIWDLKEGQDKYTFMEQMVTNPDIAKVLIISNKVYTEKANSREGGVGTESLIISDKIYKEVDQEKFIPIVTEYIDKNEPYLPAYISSRIFIDFSEAEKFEGEYEKLLRNIFGKPLYKRPPIGNPPGYLEEEEPVHVQTTNKVRRIKNSLINGDSNINPLMVDFLDTFTKALDDFKVNLQEGKEIDDLILESIDKLLFLRNDFLEVFNVYCKYINKTNNELFHDFLEKLLNYIYEKIESRHENTWQYLSLDNYRYIFWELFICITAISIKNNRFELICYQLQTPYFIFNSDSQIYNYYNFTLFRFYIETLNKIRNDRLKLNKISLASTILVEKTNNSIIKFEELRQTDILLYYLSLFNETGDRKYPGFWFPMLGFYRGRKIDFIEKLKSKTFFDKVKCLFNVNNINELKEKLEKISKLQINYNLGHRFGDNISLVREVFNEVAIIS